MNENTMSLTLSDRITIEAGIYAQKIFKKIAKEAGKHPSTISREIKNNRTLSSCWRHLGKDCLITGALGVIFPDTHQYY